MTLNIQAEIQKTGLEQSAFMCLNGQVLYSLHLTVGIRGQNNKQSPGNEKPETKKYEKAFFIK